MCVSQAALSVLVIVRTAFCLKPGTKATRFFSFLFSGKSRHHHSNHHHHHHEEDDNEDEEDEGNHKKDEEDEPDNDTDDDSENEGKHHHHHHSRDQEGRYKFAGSDEGMDGEEKRQHHFHDQIAHNTMHGFHGNIYYVAFCITLVVSSSSPL